MIDPRNIRLSRRGLVVASIVGTLSLSSMAYRAFTPKTDLHIQPSALPCRLAEATGGPSIVKVNEPADHGATVESLGLRWPGEDTVYLCTGTRPRP